MTRLVSWPTAQDYGEAVQKPLLNLNDPDLRDGTLQAAITGSFASVYRIQSNAGTWAARCFLRHLPDQSERYAAIGAHLESAKLPFIVGFEYLQKGIRVHREWYPILKMRWIEAQTLRDYIAENISTPTAIAALADRWIVMLRALRKHNIAHGDLEHGNILISRGYLRLVDYDGMFVPALSDRTSHEAGNCNYQHPGRSDNHFGAHLDNFSGWVIYLTLIALSIEPRLWPHFANGEDYLIFKKDDLEEPSSSILFHSLEQLRDDRIQKYLPMFRSFLEMGASATPSLVDVIGVASKKRETPRPVAQVLPEVQLDLFALGAGSLTAPPPVEDAGVVVSPNVGSDNFHFSGSCLRERVMIGLFAGFIFAVLTLTARGTISVAGGLLVLIAGLGCVVASITCSYMSLREVRGKFQLWFTLGWRRRTGEMVRSSLITVCRLIIWLDSKEARDAHWFAARAGQCTRRERKRIEEVKSTLSAFMEELRERRAAVSNGELDETAAMLNKLQIQHSALLQEGSFVMNAPAHQLEHPGMKQLRSWRVRVEELARTGPPIILPDDDQVTIRKKYDLERHAVQESERFALQGAQLKIERIQASAARWRQWIDSAREYEHVWFNRLKQKTRQLIEKGHLWLDENQREMKGCITEMNRYREIRLSRYLPRLFDFFPKM